MTTAPATPGDPRFFMRTGPHPVAWVAKAAGGELTGDPAPGLMLHGVAGLDLAGPGDLSFVDHRKHADALAHCRAGAVIVAPALLASVPAGCVAIVTPQPKLAWARAASLFHPVPPAKPGVHPTAAVDPSAAIDPSAEVGPQAVIGAGAQIGPRCRVGPCAVIGDGVVLGADCRIGAHVTLSHALLGERVVIYPGARIGQDGFGFEPGPLGFETVPQLGRVLIGDDAEIGANTTIDRGAGPDTVIGPGCRLDNLVQIGHNVRLGRCCVIVSQVGISGSTVLEDFVVVAGQAGLAGHLHIGAKARIGAQAGVMADVMAGADVVGAPAQPVRAFFRELAVIRKLAKRMSGPGGDRGSERAASNETPEPATGKADLD
jgi:UDP-3-O-[3-hydroxymyristoyl] glucosamine N-acyltransferase